VFDESHLIHRYSRAEAIADGVLVDVTAVAREAGIRFPVVLTRAVWDQYVKVPPGVAGQDEPGRLWDIVWMLSLAICQSKGTLVHFALHVRNDNKERTPPLVRLKAICGPGDDAEPVLTVTMPNED
jgi:hypothetical protein